MRRFAFEQISMEILLGMFHQQDIRNHKWIKLHFALWPWCAGYSSDFCDARICLAYLYFSDGRVGRMLHENNCAQSGVMCARHMFTCMKSRALFLTMLGHSLMDYMFESSSKAWDVAAIFHQLPYVSSGEIRISGSVIMLTCGTWLEAMAKIHHGSNCVQQCSSQTETYALKGKNVNCILNVYMWLMEACALPIRPQLDYTLPLTRNVSYNVFN